MAMEMHLKLTRRVEPFKMNLTVEANDDETLSETLSSIAADAGKSSVTITSDKKQSQRQRNHQPAEERETPTAWSTPKNICRPSHLRIHAGQNGGGSDADMNLAGLYVCVAGLYVCVAGHHT